MLYFLTEHAGTIFAALLVVVAAGASIVHLLRERKRGHSSCGCNCSACHGGCHPH